jgi:hypothetical protein
VGVKAGKVEMKDALGPWQSETNDKRLVNIVEPRKKEPQLLFGPDVTAQEREIEYLLNEHGFIIKPYMAHCGAGHNDTVGYLVWVPISPKRAACFTVPAFHSKLEAGLEYFSRAEK